MRPSRPPDLHAELAHTERSSVGGEHAVGAFHLAGEKQQRGGIQPRAGQAGDRVGAAGTGGDHSHTQVVDGFRVVLGCHGRGLLVRIADGLDGVALRQRGVQVHGAAASHQENVFDSQSGKEAHHVIGERRLVRARPNLVTGTVAEVRAPSAEESRRMHRSHEDGAAISRHPAELAEERTQIANWDVLEYEGRQDAVERAVCKGKRPKHVMSHEPDLLRTRLSACLRDHFLREVDDGHARSRPAEPYGVAARASSNVEDVSSR